jgi:hypothetical protein
LQKDDQTDPHTFVKRLQEDYCCGPTNTTPLLRKTTGVQIPSELAAVVSFRDDGQVSRKITGTFKTGLKFEGQVRC